MWFIIGLIAGVFVGALVLWLSSRGIKVTWYEWLIGAIGLVLLLFTIQNVVGSYAEWESTSANMFLLVTGLPAIIMLVVAWMLTWRRHRATG